MFSNLSAFDIAMKCLPCGKENGKKGDQIAGKKECNQSGSDADTYCPRRHEKASIWEKEGHHPPLQDEFEHKKSNRCGSQASKKTTEKCVLDHG